MAEISSTTPGARQRPKPWQQAKAHLLGWPLKLVGASAATFLLSQQPAKALVYNVEATNVTFLGGFRSASITGSFDYSGGTSSGLIPLTNVDIFFDSTPDSILGINFDQSFDFGWVVNQGTSSYLFFNNTNSSSLDCNPNITFLDPCLRLNISDALTETPFETRTLDSGSGAAGNRSQIGVFSLPLTSPSITANVIQAVPSPFSALLFAPLLPLLRYRRRFLSATQQSAQPNGSTIGHGALLQQKLEAQDCSEPSPPLGLRR